MPTSWPVIYFTAVRSVSLAFLPMLTPASRLLLATSRGAAGIPAVPVSRRKGIGLANMLDPAGFGTTMGRVGRGRDIVVSGVV